MFSKNGHSQGKIPIEIGIQKRRVPKQSIIVFKSNNQRTSANIKSPQASDKEQTSSQ